MRFFETKHERNSAKLTTLIMVILILLLFVVGAPYMDPPIEYGVAVNFGNSDFGQGRVQPQKPVKSEPIKKENPPQVDATKSEPTKSSEAKEEVLTQENEEAIAIKKQKEADAKAKVIADAKAKAEADRLAKEKAEQEAKKKKLDALIGGVSKSEGVDSGSEGNDTKSGDKGQLDGDPYAPYGDIPGAGAGEIGYGLNGRGKPQYKFYQACAEENVDGKVVVDIVVNQEGKVIEARSGSKGTQAKTQCLMELAKKIALSFKFPPDFKAPTRQYGKITLNFTNGTINK